MRLFFLSLVLTLLYPPCSKANLRLDTPEVQMIATPEDEIIKAEFPVKNDSPQPLKILRVNGSDPNLTVNFDKMDLQPGEVTTAKAELIIMNFVGSQQLFVHVTTTDPTQLERQFPLTVKVPQLVSIQPDSLQWNQGEQAIAKKVTIKLDAAYPARINSIFSTTDQVTWEQEEITPGHHYELTIKPNRTSAAFRGVLRLETDCKLPRYARPMVLFEITNPEQAPPPLKLNTAFVAVDAKPENESVEIEFPFKNHGQKPVRIISVGSGCACLSAKLNKWEYQSGEAGKGSVQFKVPVIPGSHERVIRVTTDHPDYSEWTVPFLLTVPAVITIEPNNIHWQVGEEPSAKKITIKFDKAYPARITSVTSTKDKVSFEQKEIIPSHHYEFWLKPKDTKTAIVGALKVETDSKIPRFSRQMAFYSIVNKTSP